MRLPWKAPMRLRRARIRSRRLLHRSTASATAATVAVVGADEAAGAVGARTIKCPIALPPSLLHLSRRPKWKCPMPRWIPRCRSRGMKRSHPKMKRAISRGVGDGVAAGVGIAVVTAIPINRETINRWNLSSIVSRIVPASRGSCGLRRSEFPHPACPPRRFSSSRCRWCERARRINIWCRMSRSPRRLCRGRAATGTWMRFRMITINPVLRRPAGPGAFKRWNLEFPHPGGAFRRRWRS